MGTPATPAAPSEQDSVGALIARLGVDLGRIVRAEVGLFGMRLVAAVDVLKTLTIGMLAGVVFATTGFGLTMLSLVLFLSRWLPPWAAALLVGGVLLALGVGLAAASVRTGAHDVSVALTANPIETYPIEMHPYD